MNKITITITLLVLMFFFNCGRKPKKNENLIQENIISSQLSDINQKIQISENPNDEKAKNISKKTYFGGWPVNYDIAALDDPGFNNPCPGSIGCECNTDFDCNVGICFKMPRGQWCSPNTGVQIPNFKTFDQYGENIELYDFSGKGKYIVIEMSAAWCRPCNLFADWMTFGEKDLSDFRWWKTEYSKIREMVLNEEIYFINVQYEDKYKDNASLQSLEDWFQTYPDNLVPILADNDKTLHTWIKPNGLPCIIVVDEQMKLAAFTQRGLTTAFDFLLDISNHK